MESICGLGGARSIMSALILLYGESIWRLSRVWLLAAPGVMGTTSTAALGLAITGVSSSDDDGMVPRRPSLFLLERTPIELALFFDDVAMIE